MKKINRTALQRDGVPERPHPRIAAASEQCAHLRPDAGKFFHFIFFRCPEYLKYAVFRAKLTEEQTNGTALPKATSADFGRLENFGSAVKHERYGGSVYDYEIRCFRSCGGVCLLGM